MPTPPRPQPVALRIELLDVTPLVWRRVLVSNQWTLASLHRYLQWVMGWTDTHAHEFEIGTGMVGPDWWIREARLDRDAGSWRDERRCSVAAVVTELGVRGEFEYRYDMGDGWRHRIVIETLPAIWMRIPRDGEQGFHWNVNTDSTATWTGFHGMVNTLPRSVARCSRSWKSVHDHGARG